VADGILQVGFFSDFEVFGWALIFNNNRSATAILPDGHYASPDLPPHQILKKEHLKDDKKAFLDFYINDNLKWGFELLREGIGIQIL
jgi:hypothetical protein